MPYPFVYVVQNLDAIAARPLDRLQRLQTEGFDVCVASPDVDGLDEVAGAGFRTLPIPGRRFRNAASWSGAYFILQGHFLESTPTLVHGIGTPWAWIAAFAAHRAGAPAVVATMNGSQSSGSTAVRRFLQALPSRLKPELSTPGRAVSLLGDWADACLVHHEEELRWLLENELLSHRKVELVLGGRGIDLDALVPDEEEGAQARARQLMGVPARARTILGAARPGTGDAEELTRMVKKSLRRTHPAVAWVTPEEGSSTRDTSFYSAIDVFVALDANDRAGTEMMKAAALAVPTVAVASPAARSIINDFETGRIVAPQKLVGALSAVLDDPKRATDMGIRARARARERFDHRHVESQTLRIYDRVLREGLR